MPSPTDVVSVFLRNRGSILLLKRSENVGTYADKWGAVAGHAEGNPKKLARREIAEETGLDDLISLVRRGDSFTFEDDRIGQTWRVHPFLFDCETRDVETNEETTDFEWISPTKILRRDTVPRLWTSYERIRPRVADVKEDHSHGSTYCAARALEVLRDEAALVAAKDGTRNLQKLAKELRESRPNMTVLKVRIDQVMEKAVRAIDIEERAHLILQENFETTSAATARAAEIIDGSVVTVSRSGTVSSALVASASDVLIAESRPGREGIDVAEKLAQAIDVTVTTDAALPGQLHECDYVLLGADAILRDGSVVNKVGSLSIAMSANRANVPVYVASTTAKVSPRTDMKTERGNQSMIYDGEGDLDVLNPLFERVPPDLITSVISDRGRLNENDVKSIAQEHARRARWMR
ncbi:MAG: NUDIX domain-containing protein [Halobacteriaceae archaeon]